MKKLQHLLIAGLIFAFVCPYSSFAQEDLSNEALHYEVHRVYPYLSLTKDELSAASTLMDLNFRYKPSWIQEYQSVEISAVHQGKWKKVTGKNETLSPAQKDLMENADVGTSISVVVRYIPKNSLKHNDPKALDFTVAVLTDQDAVYTGGQEKLQQYLKANAIDQIPAGTFTGYAMAAITFTVNAEGEIEKAQVFESSQDEAVDALLVTAIQNMPCWMPAGYASGVKVPQEFVLIVGNMENCMVNLLNIRRDGPAKRE
jgi:TonB family protein